MIALVTAAQETDAVIVAALAAFWLWRHGKLGRTVRKAVRVAVCVGAVVIAVRVSPALCVLAAGAWLAWWAWTHRHARERRRFQKAWDRGWRRGIRRANRGVTLDRAKFMASSTWQRQRAAALKRAGHRCEVRGCRGGMLEVHHNNNDVYNHLASARPSDLSVVCHSHHARISYLHQHCVDPSTGQRYTIAKATRMIMQEEAYAA